MNSSNETSFGSHRSVILHVGRHKSGTTAIQRTLVLLQEQLAQNGIRYSNCGRSKFGFANHLLALACCANDRDQLEQYKLQLSTELRSADRLVISSEGFQNLKNPEVLFNLFPTDTKVHVVIYLRDVIDYLSSSFAQHVQSSNVTSNFAGYAMKKRFDYRKFVLNWMKLSDSTTVRFYNSRHLIDGDVVSDFFSMLGLQVAPPKRGCKRANPSIGGNLLFAKLLLNRLDLPFDKATAYKSLSEAASDGERFPTGFWIDDSLTSDLRIVYAESCEFLAELFGYRDQIAFSTRPLAPNLSTIHEDLTHLAKLPGLERLEIFQNLDPDVLGMQIGGR